MSKYSFDNKLTVKNGKIEIEVLGFFPKSQPFISNISGENIYNVKINGQVCHLKESVIDAIMGSEQSIHEEAKKVAEPKPDQIAEEQKSEPEQEQEKPRRGRKPKAV